MNKIVLVGGCFDILHYGHVKFLTDAKKLGDSLVVLLESDENVKRRKGPTRPIHTQEQRKEILESLTVVDRVMVLPTMEHDSDYARLVASISPTIIAVTQGDPYKHHKEQQASAVGATVVEIPKIHTHSTSQLVKLLEIE
jgi:rfaE bifunctional protein nucleotidyltransferase chain/domain